MIGLIGETALIIGGMDTLAGDVAQRLSDAGARIVFAHLPEDEVQAKELANQIAAPERPVRTAPISFLAPDSLKSQIAQLGPARIVVITPSYFTFSAFMDTSPSDWDEALARNFEQATYTAQAAAHHLIAQGSGGCIIFLSSVASLMPLINTSAVGTSLTALRALAKMAAVDLAPHGITVNTVAVGWVEAEWASQYLTPEGRAYIEQDIPVGRISTPDDVGNACCFLASDLAAYITGAVIPVDGGYLLTRAEAGKLPYPAIM